MQINQMWKQGSEKLVLVQGHCLWTEFQVQVIVY